MRMPRAKRAWLIQALFAACLLAFLGLLAAEALANLRSRGIVSGFAFMWRPAAFDIGFSLLPFTASDSNAWALLIGLLNTLLVSVAACALSTVIGLVLGVMRLSPHRLSARISGLYVTVIRSVPVLLQMFFWYFPMLHALPSPRSSISLAGSWVFLNNRGLFLPTLHPNAGVWAGVAAAVAVLAVLRAARQRLARGLLAQLALAFLAGSAVAIAARAGLGLQRPVLNGFNFRGGLAIPPEFLALMIAMSIYAGAFIAEIVRAGLSSVAAGQVEAAQALGLPPRLALRLVTIPIALRFIVPPLSNQYLTIVKYSSLGIAIGYPDLMGVFAKGTLNHTGQAFEVLGITAAVYLLIALAGAAAMNAWNRRIAGQAALSR
jgi:general L-amino acid transport system permease protein